MNSALPTCGTGQGWGGSAAVPGTAHLPRTRGKAPGAGAARGLTAPFRRHRSHRDSPHSVAAMNRFALLFCVLFLAPSAHAEDPLPASSFGDTYGSYGPGGDCGREPRIKVATQGLEITAGGQTERLTRPEVAWSYFGQSYDGIVRTVFPYSGAERPVIMLLNEGEVPGRMRIEPHDRGWQGGPPLSPRHQALVAGSPYAKCRP